MNGKDQIGLTAMRRSTSASANPAGTLAGHISSRCVGREGIGLVDRTTQQMDERHSAAAASRDVQEFLVEVGGKWQFGLGGRVVAIPDAPASRVLRR
jgi:hypothetical protein